LCVFGFVLIERESPGWGEYALVVEGFTSSTNNAFRVSWSELVLMEILSWIILKVIPHPFFCFLFWWVGIYIQELEWCFQWFCRREWGFSSSFATTNFWSFEKKRKITRKQGLTALFSSISCCNLWISIWYVYRTFPL